MREKYYSGPCYGTYEPGEGKTSFEADQYDVNITNILLHPHGNIDHYSKFDLEVAHPENINPDFLYRVFLLEDGVLKIADFVNTIIVPATLDKEVYPEAGGSAGRFEGTFYGTLDGPIRNATSKDVTSTAASILPDNYNLIENEHEEEETVTEGKGYSLKSCLELFWKLLLFLMLLLLLIWLLGKGCSACRRGEIIPVIPCDTVFVVDTIIIRDTIIQYIENVPPDTIKRNIYTQDSVLLISMFDCQDVDGDRIKLFYNGIALSNNLLLNNEPTIFKVKPNRVANIIKIVVLETPENACTVGINVYNSDGEVLLQDCLLIDDKKSIEVTINRQ
jgi:hypothetical protein